MVYEEPSAQFQKAFFSFVKCVYVIPDQDDLKAHIRDFSPFFLYLFLGPL